MTTIATIRSKAHTKAVPVSIDVPVDQREGAQRATMCYLLEKY